MFVTGFAGSSVEHFAFTEEFLVNTGRVLGHYDLDFGNPSPLGEANRYWFVGKINEKFIRTCVAGPSSGFLTFLKD